MSILLNLKTGIKNKNYKVKSISICNKNMLYRLSALGIKKGSEVCIKRKCLFNGPSIIEVNGQFLCIRQSDARNITLEE
ncbi:FeoA domain protein [Staphylococcus lugdunensis]|uniref:FeoA domain protein n=2 Tax=Staphylococcus TaxID=1279 RepID=A0ABD4EIQ6_STALU|nr:FeoA domain protein [Staphylococcus lugdunensis M23590]KXA40260.1 FeoA domain protein [Staphylococcus lugdunensis]